MIEVCKEEFTKWYRQNKEILFAGAAIIFAIAAFVCMYIDWKISLASAIISRIVPCECKEGIFYRVQKYGRILSRIILYLIILWIIGKFIIHVGTLYTFEKRKAYYQYTESGSMYRHKKKFVEYWYVIPQGFVEFIKDIF